MNYYPLNVRYGFCENNSKNNRPISQMNNFRTARCDFTRKFAIFVPKLLMKVS